MATDVHIRHVPFGTTPDRVSPGELYLDVGGSFRPGVIDHHQPSGGHSYASTARMVFTLLQDPEGEHWPGSNETGRRLLTMARSTAPVVLRTHNHPDYDAAVACCLVILFFRSGRVPLHLEPLVGVADRVDQGCFADDPLRDDYWYLVFWALQDAGSGDALVSRFLSLVDELSAASRKPDDLLVLPSFGPAAGLLSLTQEIFGQISRRADARLPVCVGDSWHDTELDVTILELTNEARRYLLPLKALHRKRSRSVWVVHDPDACGGRGRITLSVDGSFNNGLFGYGRALEFAERRLRRVHGDPEYPDRGGPPRTGYRNSDPWYDGRGHRFTIVDSPNGGTIFSRFVDDGYVEAIRCMKRNRARFLALARKDRLLQA